MKGNTTPDSWDLLEITLDHGVLDSHAKKWNRIIVTEDEERRRIPLSKKTEH
jgi:hypothetical protein